MRAAIVLGAAVMLTFSLAGCGGGTDNLTVNAALVGNWQLVSYTQDGVTHPAPYLEGWLINADRSFTHRGTSPDYGGDLYTVGTSIFVNCDWANDSGQIGKWSAMPYEIVGGQLSIHWADSTGKPIISTYGRV